MSPKKAALMPEYRRLIKERKAAQIKLIGYTYCSLCGKQCDPGPHHPRGRVGVRLLDFVLAGWECCHKKLHENTRKAKETGDIIDSTRKPVVLSINKNEPK